MEVRDLTRVLIAGLLPGPNRELPDLLREAGFTVDKALSGEEALRMMKEHDCCALVIAADTDDISPQSLLKSISRRFPVIKAAVLLPRRLPDSGPDDPYLDFSGRSNRKILEAIRGLKNRRPEQPRRTSLVGRSDAMERIRHTIDQIAATSMTVLITGESGTGKDVVARLLHEKSDRNGRPFIAVNCAALPEGVLESELFGHEKGAFTGATARRQGRFELANTGTLFMDEIGDMPIQTQAKLLRILEEKRFLRVGGTKNVVIDVRLIAATNSDLETAVFEGRFRKDLFYRINVIQVHIPPLRDRREDIPELVAMFVGDICSQQEMEPIHFTPEAMEHLSSYHWPGNVRQLRNLVEKTSILESGRTIDLALASRLLGERFARDRNLPVPAAVDSRKAEHELLYQTLLAVRQDIRELKDRISGGTGLAASFGGGEEHRYGADAQIVELDEQDETPGGRAAADYEREAIRQALKESGGNRRRAAEILKIGERTLYRKIKKFKLEQ